MPEHFFVLLRAEGRAFGAQQLRNLSAPEREQLLRRRAVALGVDDEDDVVFAEKVVARPQHRRLDARQHLPAQPLRGLREPGVILPFEPGRKGFVPGLRQGPRHGQRQHPVIESLHAHREAVHVPDPESACVERQGRLLILKIDRCRGLGGQPGRHRPVDPARKLRQVDGVADIEHEERGHVPGGHMPGS